MKNKAFDILLFFHLGWIPIMILNDLNQMINYQNTEFFYITHMILFSLLLLLKFLIIFEFQILESICLLLANWGIKSYWLWKIYENKMVCIKSLKNQVFCLIWIFLHINEYVVGQLVPQQLIECWRKHIWMDQNQLVFGEVVCCELSSFQFIGAV